MRQERKVEVLEISFDHAEDFIRVEFLDKRNQYCMLFIVIEDFEKWLGENRFLNIDYENYNPSTGEFTPVEYTITKEDFFSEDDYLEYRERLAKLYLKEILK